MTTLFLRLKMVLYGLDEKDVTEKLLMSFDSIIY